MWSGPRTISTALMRAWENRPDTVVVDEPLYGFYLARTGIAHPGRDEIIQTMENGWPEVIDQLTLTPLPAGKTVLYAKHMTHHLLPEVDRGALGAATHLSRLVPQHKARAMMYTSATATAAELHAFGSVLRVVPREQLRDCALELAAEVAAKDPAVIRMAKEAFNGIDPWDVKRSYRYEQGYTFELNLSGVSDRLRASFGQDGQPAGDE